jgi:hypothetical protein
MRGGREATEVLKLKGAQFLAPIFVAANENGRLLRSGHCD